MTFNEHDIERDRAGKFAAKRGSNPDVKLLPPDLNAPEWETYGRSVAAAYRYYATGAHESGGYDAILSEGPTAQTTLRGELHNLNGPARVTFSVDENNEIAQHEEYFVYGEQLHIEPEMFDRMEKRELEYLDEMGLPYDKPVDEPDTVSWQRDVAASRAYSETIKADLARKARRIGEERAGMSR